MTRAIPVNDGGKVTGYLVQCPACAADGSGASCHEFVVGWWTFSGDLERPTFSPSMLATAVYGAHGPGRREHRCHSFVRDGKIQYLSDCTHAMAGQTVDLPDFDAV